ncbi:acetolactate synthase large subunit [Actinoplanes sp. NPDC051343]|uniref:acetolactate synthase large subunit n=1 Tax=Actinoplanes sp. NPDC051343 TaxID=3363906 RepID=UPI00378D45A8
MRGAESVVESLLAGGVDVCFANPGTSEMHFVAALDRYPQMRGVLCLFEGVATGAADGFGRMAVRPAAALLHLGPGLGNGLANLHNARRAGTPLVVIVGEHAAGHKPLDSPLDSDIDAVAATVSAWVRRPSETASLGADVADAIVAAQAGVTATLIVGADLSWSEGGIASSWPKPSEPQAAAALEIEEVLRTGRSTAILLDGDALTEESLRAANRVAQATGSRLLCPTWPARLRRGSGVPPVTLLPYRGEAVRALLDGVSDLVLVGATRPVASFAYPGQDGDLVPDGVRVHTLTAKGTSSGAALRLLADTLAPSIAAKTAPSVRPQTRPGPLTVDNWAAVVGAVLPENAIVCDESITAGMDTLADALAGAPAHDVLGLTGLAIGQGLPLAAGAAIAAPDRPVICLEADGSAMYTISALWTHAREGLDVTTVILNNRSYAILRAELDRVGARRGSAASEAMFDLSRPDLDFVRLAEGMGVPATRATTVKELTTQIEKALAEPGPHLIEAVLSRRP